ncbi:MAG: hypothetical protein V3U60_11170 [Gammaproteobacteria bacterium]
MSCEVFQKDIGGTRRVIVDYSSWLGSSEVASAAWTVPSGVTQANSSITSSTAINYFSGGTDGQQYEIKVCITTNDAAPRIKCVTFLIDVRATCD